MRGAHLLLALALLFALWASVEATLGKASRASGDPVKVVDPGGRRLMLVVLDSLTPEDAADMPSWRALEKRGLSAEVEPCLERITYVCVKDALTGRSAFSLFGVLENWGTALADPGENLLRDARAAGRKVAMVSAGDIAAFGPDIDDEERFPDRFEDKQVLLAFRYALTHDIVVYHDIWHDTQAHHDPVGSPGYRRSVARMDQVLNTLVKTLPKDMDLIVTGDHGHGPDGRHVQGQDIPTALVAVSPRIRPGRVEGRLPIHAVRFLAGAATGLMTDRMEWDPAWARWLGPGVSAQARALVEGGSPPRVPSVPWGPVVVLGLVVALAAHAAGRGPALVAAAVGAGLGLGFEAWLAWMHFPGERPRVDQVLWLLPAGLTLLGLLRGPRGAWTLALGASAASLLLLFPVPHHYGVLQNIGSIGLAALAGPALALLWPPLWAPQWPPQWPLGWQALRPWPAMLLAGALAYMGWWWMGDVQVFNLEIVRKWGAVWVPDLPWLALGLNALLAAGLQRAMDPGPRAWPFVALAATGAVLGHQLPPLVAAVPVAACLVAVAWPGPTRGRALGLASAWAMPYLYGLEEQHGILVIVAATGASLWLIDRAWSRLSPGAPWGALARGSAGVALAAGGYLAMAWTFGLAIATVDFTFALPWLPGRMHERLWWLIFILTTMKCLLPVLLVPPLARGLLGERAAPALRTGQQVALLRFVVVCAFAVVWVLHMGSGAAGLRLAAVLQDAFFWMLIALSLWSGGWAEARVDEPLPAPSPGAGMAAAP